MQAIFQWKSLLEEQALGLKNAYLERKMQGQMLQASGHMQGQYVQQLQEAVQQRKQAYNQQLDGAAAQVRLHLQQFESEQKNQLHHAATQLRCMVEQQSSQMSVDYLQRQMQAKLVQNVADASDKNAALAGAVQAQNYAVAQRVQQHNAGIEQGKQLMAQGYTEAELFHRR